MILARAPGFAVDETLRLPPRHPGQGLHHSLIDVARAQDKQETRTALQIARARDREKKAAAVVAATGTEATDAAGTPAGSGGKAATVGSSKPVSRASTVAGPKGVSREEADAMAGGIDRKILEGGQLSDGDGKDDQEAGENLDLDGLATADTAAEYGNEPWLEPLPNSGKRTPGGAENVPLVARPVPEWDRVPTFREQGRAHDVILVGPPMSGKSTLSRALAAKYQTMVLSVDLVIAETLRLRTPLGARVRAAVHWFTAKEKVRFSVRFYGVVCFANLPFGGER